MKWLRRVVAWWLWRPEGFHYRGGRLQGTRLSTFFAILYVILMLTVGLPITLVLWARYVWRIYRGDIKWPYK